MRSLIKNINLRSFIIVFALIAIWIALQIATDGTFLTSRNISLLFRQMTPIGIISIGMVLVIVAGHIDLSVGSIVAVSGAIAAVMQTQMQMGTVPTIIALLITGIIVGVVNGYFSTFQKIPPFIVTLATMLIFRGATLLITGGSTISGMNPSFKFIGDGYIPQQSSTIIATGGIIVYLVFEIVKRRGKTSKGMKVTSANWFGLKLVAVCAICALLVSTMNNYEGIPIPVIIMAAIMIVVSFISRNTRFGRRLYAMGGNSEAARLSGININKEGLKVFALLGLLSAVSGLILTARLDAATPAAGNQFEFDAISAAIIGGASFSGGQGTVFGAVIGALIMASLNNGMSILNIPSAAQFILKGLVLLIAVWFDMRGRVKGK
ncbi:MAG: sugar ABC transporter permease [Candidatus Cohnella colombiensis]|uniref:Xylose transport system permease protein XylH n=1 Tax=Candidatus Cohnella colombiensis TaxID=3121368 RepID=A0AA95EZZ0_9BACL|nr:MAG: sugar ABC transporter permease [Cohnella sp.]